MISAVAIAANVVIIITWIVLIIQSIVVIVIVAVDKLMSIITTIFEIKVKALLYLDPL